MTDNVCSKCSGKFETDIARKRGTCFNCRPKKKKKKLSVDTDTLQEAMHSPEIVDAPDPEPEWAQSLPDDIQPEKQPLDVQVGGGHYKDMVIQPVEFNQKNQLNFCEGSVVKYISRHRQKNGLQDLEKAKHFIDMLIQMEYSPDI